MNEQDILTAAARIRLAKRKRVPGTCVICSATFEKYPGAKFCSDACRAKAFQPKRRARRAAPAPE